MFSGEGIGALTKERHRAAGNRGAFFECCPVHKGENRNLPHSIASVRDRQLGERWTPEKAWEAYFDDLMMRDCIEAERPTARKIR